jgi:hypothetical protein
MNMKLFFLLASLACALAGNLKAAVVEVEGGYFVSDTEAAKLGLKVVATPAATPEQSGRILDEQAAHKFGYQLAAYIKKGYSVSDQNLYAMCSMEGQQEGYHGEELERFINIARRDAAKLSQ